MKKIFIISFTLFVSMPLFAQDSISVFGSMVKYLRPDSSQWKIVQNGIDKQSGNYILMFTHNPIKDSLDKESVPSMTIVCAQVPDSMDIMKYSIWKRTQFRFKINRVIGADTKDISYPNSIGYEGEYISEAAHKILVGHFRRNLAGVQVVCDAEDGVYNIIESDMRLFLKSITLEDQ